MINLMLNEFKKIFSKKSTYIIFVIIILFILAFTLLNKYTDQFLESFFYHEFSGSKEDIERQMRDIERSGFKGIEKTEEMWLSFYHELDTIETYEKIDKKEGQEWKKDYIYDDPKISETIAKLAELDLKVAKTKDNTILKTAEYINLKEKYDNLIDDFLKLTEEEYTDILIKKYKKEIKDLNKEITNLKNQEKADKSLNLGSAILKIQDDIKIVEHYLNIAEIRKEKKIPYKFDNFMTRALADYDYTTLELEEKEKPKDDAPETDKKQYYEIVRINEEAKHKLETEQDIDSMQTANYAIKSFLSSNILLYMVIIIVITGTIVSEEYSKGTIKNLLVKPYKRSTILLSKLFVILIMILIIYLILFIAQVLIAGVSCDFKTISQPVVEYNISVGQLQKYNLFYYSIREFIYILPYILIFVLFTFAVSTITTSSAAAISLGMVSFMATQFINSILMAFPKDWMKYIPTLYWDFRKFISPGYNPTSGINLKMSIIITVATMLLFLIPTFIAFNKKDIKNI